MKTLILALLTLLVSSVYGERPKKIEVSAIEDLSFKKIAVSQQNKEKIMAKGYIEIKLEESLKKDEEYARRLLVINHPNSVYLSNKNQNLKVENINIAAYTGEEGIIVKEPTVTRPGVQVIFEGRPLKLEVSGIVDRKQIDSQKENVEGEYAGNLPLDVREYIEIGG